MKCGRDLDALVAEKVFGWCHYWDSKAWWVSGDKHCGSIASEYWSPSQNIADAWQVVEKMRERGFAVFELSRDESGEWCALIDKSWPPSESEFADTAPHAICLAALRAVGVEVGKEE